MKTMIARIGMPFLLVVFSVAGWGQEYTKLERSKILHFDNESLQEEVKIDVPEEYNYFRIKIQGRFNKGDVLVEWFDPSGELMRDFTIKSGSKGAGEGELQKAGAVAGEMEKAFRDPETGTWVVRVTADHAEGQLRVYSLLISNPRTHLMELEQIEKDTDAHIK
jgi:hypothetical protein